MNTSELVDSFERGLLLGDLIADVTGDDVDVCRTPNRQQREFAENPDYILLHDAVTSYAEHTLSTAQVYWNGSIQAWSAMARIRMKHLLHQCGFTVTQCHFDSQSNIIQRTLQANCPGGTLLLVEDLHLQPISSIIYSTTKYTKHTKDYPR